MLRKAPGVAAALIATALASCAALATCVTPRPSHPFFDHRRPMTFAHRGGSGLWPENTLHAFRRAAELGVDVLEMDVDLSVDQTLVVFHDAEVDRTTNGRGPLSELTLAKLKALDAGYSWSEDGGETFPFRGLGITVATLEEVFQALPTMRMNLEVKRHRPSLVHALCRLIREYGMETRVLVASYDQDAMDAFRTACPEVASAATAAEVRSFFRLNRFFLSALFRPRGEAFQVPEQLGALTVLTPRFVEAAHRLNVQVHVWTANEVGEMKRLIELGVDGIMTDYPDRLLNLLGR
ncbi:MAG: glycerophosphodiester phosphodiesterase [Acidobacteriota bacterium]